MSASSLPFPTRPQRSRELVLKHFWRCDDKRCPDESFHFSIVIPNGWGALDTPVTPPTVGGPLVSLGVYRNATLVTAEVEVHACMLTREVAPAQWLDIYLDRLGVELLERREVRTEGGTVADVLTRSPTSDEPLVTRWLAMKNYNRLFLIEGRALAPNYPSEAEAIFLAVTSVSLLNPVDWPLAERLLSYSRHLPGDFLLLYPESWTLTEDPGNDERALQIKLVQRVENVAVGTLAFVTVARDAESDPHKLLARFIDDVRRAGATLEVPPLLPGEPRRDFERTWHATAVAALGPVPMEVRAWIGERPDAWFFLGLYGPARAADDECWAVNTRAFEVVLRYLKVE
ncbi:hypothetical protein SAMN02745121_08839 [Nannocystis exedens]|uniref:Uncharacterized protein n=1 Tax=Nannocystis exedens TaxID=54 RepID=A0A1I2IP82_9BACT|nr:hypothetical protein [Nannocystis exedens]PCC68144.1 hypothetical protein NAEX_01153 [Nannocystis exedens]SFF43443.1 hypothetical protein SAMN02745121_08839 [Nannocystis exedens]